MNIENNKLNITHEIADAIRICLFNKEVINRVSKDEKASNIAFVIFFLYLLIGLFLNPIYFVEYKFSYLADFMFSLISNVIILLLIHKVSKLFGNKATFISFLRPIGYSFILGILILFAVFSIQGINYLGNIVFFIVIIWWLLLWLLIQKVVFKISIFKSIGIFLIVVLLIFVIMIVIGLFLAFGMPEVFSRILALADM